MKEVFAEAEKKSDPRWRAEVWGIENVPFETITDYFPGSSVRPGKIDSFRNEGYKILAPNRETVIKILDYIFAPEGITIDNDHVKSKGLGKYVARIRPPAKQRANPPAIRQILDRIKGGEKMTLRDMARLYAQINNNPTKNPGYGDPLRAARDVFLQKDLDGTYSFRPDVELKPPYVDRRGHTPVRQANFTKEKKESEAAARKLLAYLQVNPMTKTEIRKAFKQILGYEPLFFQGFMSNFFENALDQVPNSKKFAAKPVQFSDDDEILSWMDDEADFRRDNFRD